MIDPTFSESSFGFRPGRSARAALHQAREYVADGHEIVVNLDLEKVLDRVNRDIRRFLEAGMMADGVCAARQEGTPRGGPLSPLLANLLLDDLHKELKRRGHRFCRYADDCNIRVRSRVAVACFHSLGLISLEQHHAAVDTTGNRRGT